MSAASNGVYGSGVSWSNAVISSLPGIGLVAIVVNSCDGTSGKVNSMVKEHQALDVRLQAQVREAYGKEQAQARAQATPNAGQSAASVAQEAVATEKKSQIKVLTAVDEAMRKHIVNWSAFAISCALTAVALVVLSDLGYITGQYVQYAAVGVPTGLAVGSLFGIYRMKSQLEENKKALDKLIPAQQ